MDNTEKPAAGDALRVAAQDRAQGAKIPTVQASPGGIGLRTILNAIPQMVWSTRADGYHDFYNDRWYEFTGAVTDTTDGDAWTETIHPDDRERARERWRRSLKSGDPYEVEYRLRRHGGAYRWILGRAAPMRDASGAIERWFGTCTDVDDLKQAERETAKLAAVVEQSADFVGVAANDGFMLYVNEAGLRLVGLPDRHAVKATAIPDYFAPESRETLRRLVLARLGEDVGWAGELALHNFATGEAIPAQCEISPIHDPEARLVGYAMTTRDLRERKRSEEALALIAGELSHRIKNIFAVVSSLVALSARTDPAARPFAEIVGQRIDALARAHDYVHPERPDAEEGFGTQTMRGLLMTLLAPYREDASDRIMIEGAEIPIGVQSATALALVVHELATNAVKYGALSAPSGRVTLDSRHSGEDYVLTWTERGGPAVSGPPKRHGFGTTMSARVATAQLGATITHDWDERGLVVRLSAPLFRMSL